MRKLILLALAAAALAVPALALASGGSHHRDGARHHARAGGVAKAAVAACRSEREADLAAFRAKYANENGRRAFRRCVRRHVRHARRECRAERSRDVAAFRKKYANEKGRHAFRRCVRAHSGDAVA